MRDAGGELADIKPAFDIALGVGDGFAVLLGQHRGQLVDLCADQVDEFCEHPATLLRIAGRPAGLCFRGVRDGRLDLGDIRQRNLSHGLAECRVVYVGEAPGGAGNALTGDEMRQFG
ncbi:Uncharacterised protein [Mycobacteroides abscessus]|nr:Uncharacterised protein [Mycobacteroides abscessus]